MKCEHWLTSSQKGRKRRRMPSKWAWTIQLRFLQIVKGQCRLAPQHKTPEMPRHKRVFTPTCNLLFRGSWERLEAESLPQWEPGEGSGREAFILCRTKASRHGERGNKPGYPRVEVRTTEAKVVYMKKLSSCLENQCDGRPSSSHPGHTMTEVGSYELGWWDGK